MPQRKHGHTWPALSKLERDLNVRMAWEDAARTFCQITTPQGEELMVIRRDGSRYVVIGTDTPYLDMTTAIQNNLSPAKVNHGR